MTEDTKKNILNYITNNITTTSPSTAEVIKEVVRNNDEWDSYIEVGFTITDFISPNENYSGIGVIYGGYEVNSVGKGFILLVDQNFNPIKLFTQYDNGTDLRFIQKMAQSDDNTFYMIDDTSYYSLPTSSPSTTSEKRFIMLNNFTALDNMKNDYVLTFRTSYILQGTNSNFMCKKLAKNPNSAHYIMVGFNGVFNIKAIELKIEVGQPNDWSSYQTTNRYNFGDCIIDFNSDDQARVRGTVSEMSSPFQKIYKLYKNYANQVLGTELMYTSTYPINMVDCKFTDFNHCYLVNDTQDMYYVNDTNQDAVELYGIDYLNNTVSKIYSNINARVDVYYGWKYERIYISACNGDIYVANAVNSEPNPFFSGPRPIYFYFQRLVNDSWSPNSIITIEDDFMYDDRQLILMTKQNFNYFVGTILNIQATGSYSEYFFRYIQVKENYNPLNYNGAEYIDYNSAVPKQAEVYSDGSLVFARNLYNFTINENQSNATVVVPNTYLNNINLDAQDLLSETNTEIVNNNNTVIKNIYETLYLNFINTIDVIDEDANIVYPESAVYINNNINTGTQINCEATAITKAKITTENNSNIINITWTPIDDTNQETSFSIYVGEPILKIELISDDETTSYMTIDTSSIDVGNFYTISQKIRIE